MTTIEQSTSAPRQALVITHGGSAFAHLFEASSDVHDTVRVQARVNVETGELVVTGHFETTLYQGFDALAAEQAAQAEATRWREWAIEQGHQVTTDDATLAALCELLRGVMFDYGQVSERAERRCLRRMLRLERRNRQLASELVSRWSVPAPKGSAADGWAQLAA